MSAYYNGAHQVCFYKRNFIPWQNKWETDSPKFSWDDFHLIPQARPQIAIPKANYSMIPIPATSVRYDITNELPGGLTYESVTGSWVFIVDQSKWQEEKSWIRSFRELEKYFDGSQFIVELLDDPGALYNGRLYIASHESGDSYSTVTINYDFVSGDFEIPEDFFFRIRFLDYYGNELQSDLMKKGDTPVYYKELPNDAVHVFNHWEPEIDVVRGNQDYIASSDIAPVYHPIVFYNADGDVVERRYCVPVNMDIETFNMKPMIEALGVYNIPLEDFWRIPDNMKFMTD